VAAAARDVDAVVLGGDLTRSPGPLVLDITALGSVTSPVLRSGARPGDEVWVTGALGGAAAAVKAWLAGRSPPPARTCVRPPDAPDAGGPLAGRAGVPTAMVDLSDGLAGDAATSRRRAASGW
jgi:thiamine-monophosphate kinase